jgi:alanine racemase
MADIRDGVLAGLAPAAARGGILRIDLTAVTENWRDLGRRVAPAECAAVVKADGYGCGIEPVVTALAHCGCKTFFVADLSEAGKVRQVAPDAIVYVLCGVLPGTSPTFAQLDVRPVIESVAELIEWNEFCAAQEWLGAAALQVDTGMNRLGLSPKEVVALADSPQSTGGIRLIMSHFAVADEPSHPLSARQMADFHNVRLLFPGIPASLANSAGIFLGPDAHHDLVRPGAALFGINPTPSHLNPMRAVVRLEGRILQVREVAAGETVGYGATWTAGRPSRIATVGIGYADGIFRAAGGSDTRSGAEAIVAGTRCPLAGRVSMDLLAVDVTALPSDRPRRGDLAVLLNEDIGVDEFASHTGTIGYELLVRLGRRFWRVYAES